MKKKHQITTLTQVVKEIRDDIEDGKLDETIKELEKEKPKLFLKAKIIKKIQPLPLKD